MKISAVKATLQTPIKKVLPYSFGVMTLVGCTQPIVKIKDYCEEFDKPAVEYKECIDKCEGKNSPKDQAILDSLAYRDLLNGTKLANDSSTIAEFNKICATNRYYGDNIFDFETNLLESGISTKEYNNIKSKTSPACRQFEADKSLFGRFFRNKGLMTEDFAREFIAVSKFLNPLMNYDVNDIDDIKKDVSDSELKNLGISAKEIDERNILTIKSIDNNGMQKNILNIKTINNQ